MLCSLLALQVLKSFSAHPSVLSDALHACATLCNKNARAQSELLRFDMLQVVLRVVSEFRTDPRIVVGAAMTLSALSQNVEQVQRGELWEGCCCVWGLWCLYSLMV